MRERTPGWAQLRIWTLPEVALASQAFPQTILEARFQQGLALAYGDISESIAITDQDPFCPIARVVFDAQVVHPLPSPFAAAGSQPCNWDGTTTKP